MAIVVYDKDGHVLLAPSEGEAADAAVDVLTVPVMRWDDGTYRFVSEVASVAQRAHQCRYCAKAFADASDKAQHERGRACLKCSKPGCGLKLDSLEAKARHEAECDADDKQLVLAECWAKAPNELWGVYDLE